MVLTLLALATNVQQTVRLVTQVDVYSVQVAMALILPEAATNVLQTV